MAFRLERHEGVRLGPTPGGRDNAAGSARRAKAAGLARGAGLRLARAVFSTGALGPPEPRPGSCCSASPPARGGAGPGQGARATRSLADRSPAAAPAPDGCQKITATQAASRPHADAGQPVHGAPLPGDTAPGAPRTQQARGTSARSAARTASPAHAASTPRSPRPPRSRTDYRAGREHLAARAHSPPGVLRLVGAGRRRARARWV